MVDVSDFWFEAAALLESLSGGVNMRPIDIVDSLPRHETKRYSLRRRDQIKRFVVHCTDWNCTPLQLAEYDILPNHISSTGCPAITYHELVTDEGLIYYSLPYEEISWHAGVWNKGSLAIALIHRVSDKNGKDTYAPTMKAIKSLQCRIGDLSLELGVDPTKVYGHREMKHTGWDIFNGSKRLRKTCPGMQVDLDLLRKNVASYVQIQLLLARQYDGEIDGIWGPKSKAAFKRYQQERNR